MNFVVKKKPCTVLQPRPDHVGTRKNSKPVPRNNRRTYFGKRAASKPPSLIIKLKNERFITAKNEVETIKNNNVVTESKKDDNDNFEQIQDRCGEKDVLPVEEVTCQSCLVEETVVEHGCDDDVIIVKTINSTLDVEDDGDKTPELTEAKSSTGQVHLDNDDVQLLEDHTLDLLEQFVQGNCEAHTLVKQDIEKDLFGDLDSCLSELMPRVRDLDTLEKEVWDGLDIFNRVEEIEARDLMAVGHSFHSGNSNRRSRAKKACGVKVLYDCKACPGVFMTMGELLHHQERIHAKVFSCDVCDKTFRKEAYLETHRGIHFCSNCGVFEKFKGTICDPCKGKKKKTLPPHMKSTKKSLSTPMKSSLPNSNIWKKKATANLSRFLMKSRNFRH